MSKATTSLQTLPPDVEAQLAKLGEQLKLARLRRRETQKAWASRLGVSIPTLSRLESGDPAVGMGIYAMALWLMGRSQALTDLADPALDRGALEMDIRSALKQSVRKPVSVEAKIKRGRS